VLLIHVISPDYAAKIVEIAMEKLYESGMPEQQVDAAIAVMEKFSGPTFMLIFGIIGSVILGLIISLITSIFTKRNRPMFVND
jgi:hypothetical protein